MKRGFQTFMGSRFPTEGGGDYDPAARLRDMDTEGTDVHFIVHGGGAGHPDPSLEMEFIKADHRYLADFCGTNVHRLKTCIAVTPHAIEGSVAEIKRWGREPWAAAIYPHFPLDYPLDHPDMNPIWAAAADEGLAVIHHSGLPAIQGIATSGITRFLVASPATPGAPCALSRRL